MNSKNLLIIAGIFFTLFVFALSSFVSSPSQNSLAITLATVLGGAFLLSEALGQKKRIA